MVKKQNVLVRCSAEAKFRTLTHGICEGIRINRILKKLKVSRKTPIRGHCDYKAPTAITHNPVLHDRTKHIEVDKHFIKEKVDVGVNVLCISYLSTIIQTADMLTKGLSERQFDKCLSTSYE